MLCLNKYNDKYTNKQYCETWVEKLFYDSQKDYSCLLIMIQKGVRHQIRCHLSSIGCPIIGENIYKKKKDSGHLHLWSIGIQSI
jgi:23S rRNA-/tRNA-specific pseudouridylate synthase